MKRKLNILFVQDVPCIRNYKMASALRSYGHSVSLAYMNATLSQIYPGLSDDTYNHCFQFSNIQQLWRIMKDFDAIHCHNEPDALTIAAMAGGGIVIHDTHDLLSFRPPENTDISVNEGIANRGSAGRIYSTPAQMQAAHQMYGTNTDKSVVIYNYALEADIPAEPMAKHDDGVHIVYEGSIGTGHRDYRELFSRLATAGLHVHIYPNRHNTDYEKLCADPPCLHYHQPISPQAIIGEMSQYDYGIVPFNITPENKPFLDTCIANKLFEYLAAGLPVISCDTKGLREFVEREKVGMVYETAADIIANVDTLKDIQIGEAQKYTMESQMPILLEFYEMLIKDRLKVGGVLQDELYKEHRYRKFNGINERPVEYAFLMESLSGLSVETVLDVGAGMTGLPRVLSHCGYTVDAIDSMGGIRNPYYYITPHDISISPPEGLYDFISCISTLEHIPEAGRAVENILAALNPGGYAVFTFPYCETQYIENVYDVDGVSYGDDYPYICQIFSRQQLDKWFADYDIIDQEYWRKYTGELWGFGDPIDPVERVEGNELHQLTCLLIRKSEVAPVDAAIPTDITPLDPVEAERSHPDRVSQVYAGEIPWDEPTRTAIRRRIDAIVNFATGFVLDIGCSDGIASILIGRRGHKVVGIDFLPEHIQRAKVELAAQLEPCRSVQFAEGNAEKLYFPDDTFDTVILGQIIEHVADDKAVLAEAFRVLKPDGLLLCSVPVGNNDVVTHVNWYIEETFTTLMQEHFTDVKVINFGLEMLAVCENRGGIVTKQVFANLPDNDYGQELMIKAFEKAKKTIPVIVPRQQPPEEPASIPEPPPIPVIVPVKRAAYHFIKDVKLEESQYWDAYTMRAHQEKLLRDMMQHCYDRVSFWTATMDRLGLKPVDIGNIEDLQKLPIIDKDMMRDNIQFISRNALYWKPSMSHTGGSTGRPFEHMIGKNQRDAIAATVWRGWGWAGKLHGDRMITLSGDGLGAQGGEKLNTVGMTDAIMEGFARKIKEYNPDGFRGLPYPMTLFCKFLERFGVGDTFRARYALTTSENLLDDQRRWIGGYLGEVFDQYGTNDGGTNAMECEQHNGLHISQEIAIFEVVDENDNALPPGSEGQLVVTGLYSYPQPWVRYRTHDVATIETAPCPCGRTSPRLTNLQGRVTDFIVTDAATFSGTALCNAINQLPMRAYQFEQVERNHIIVRIVKEPGYSESDTEFIECNIRKYDPAVKLSFQFVDDIPQTPAGKCQYVIGLKEGAVLA